MRQFSWCLSYSERQESSWSRHYKLTYPVSFVTSHNPPRGNKSYLVVLRAAKAATCGNDVEDARFPLLTGRVARPTHDSPIVHLCHRRIRQIGMRRARPTRNSGCPVTGLGYVDRLRRVVEGPLEAVGWRVCLYLAYHVSIFVARYAVHALLVWTTDRFVCEQQIVQCNKLKHVPGWTVDPQTVSICRRHLISNKDTVATMLLAKVAGTKIVPSRSLPMKALLPCLRQSFEL